MGNRRKDDLGGGVAQGVRSLLCQALVGSLNADDETLGILTVLGNLRRFAMPHAKIPTSQISRDIRFFHLWAAPRIHSIQVLNPQCPSAWLPRSMSHCNHLLSCQSALRGTNEMAAVKIEGPRLWYRCIMPWTSTHPFTAHEVPIQSPWALLMWCFAMKNPLTPGSFPW